MNSDEAEPLLTRTAILAGRTRSVSVRWLISDVSVEFRFRDSDENRTRPSLDKTRGSMMSDSGQSNCLCWIKLMDGLIRQMVRCELSSWGQCVRPVGADVLVLEGIRRIDR
jgi:hypothetical protein